jgi:regulation of enolase protein 1 (concanavalin A-like superfamily)
MIRGSLSANSAQAFMLVSAGKGVAYQRRLSNGASSVSSPGTASTAPRWVKLTRSGNTITAFESANGSTWTQVGSSTFSMPASVLVGLGVSSHVKGVSAAATFDNVSVTADGGQTASLPEGWNDRDIGAVNAAGKASYTDPVFTVSARGADIWGTADAFHYVYTALTGDATVITRVPSLTFANAWSKAGIMVRETIDAAAKHATILVSAGRGVAFQRRPTTGGESVSTAGSPSAPPRWLKLVRSGNTFTASESPNGSSWTTVGSTTISMNSSVLVGLAVTSHTSSATATATFDNVSIE